jgi:hypothetical protein
MYNTAMQSEKVYVHTRTKVFVFGRKKRTVDLQNIDIQ